MKYLKTYEKLKPIIKYYKNGQKESEYYFLNGKYYRENGPAHQYWYENGQKSREEYYINDKYHREDGPAVQWWYEDGQNEDAYYYLNGDNYSREEWIDKLKEIGSPHYQDQLLKYEAEKYNL